MNSIPEEQKRFFAIKLLEKDDKIQDQLEQIYQGNSPIDQHQSYYRKC